MATLHDQPTQPLKVTLAQMFCRWGDIPGGHDQRPVLSLCGHRVGVSICWDNTYPEIPAGYARGGARIVIMPHAWDSDALDEQGRVNPGNGISDPETAGVFREVIEFLHAKLEKPDASR